MNYRRLFLRSPKWAIAGTIFIGSSLLFGSWWYFGKNRSVEDDIVLSPVVPRLLPPTPETAPAPKVIEAPPVEEPTPPLQVVTPPTQTREIREIPQAIDTTGWEDKALLLGDRDLLEFSDGKLITLVKDWHEGEFSSGDEIVFLPESKVFAISGGRHSIDVMRPNGHRLGPLTLSSGGDFDGYVADQFTEAIYVKEGDLWRGSIDWHTARIINETQITNLGYFLGSPFKGRLLGATSSGLIYRDARMGDLAVNLQTGETTSVQLPASFARSPTGKLVVGDTPSSPPQFFILDVSAIEVTAHEIPWRIPQNGLVWVGETRAALVLANEVFLYDHETKSLTGLYQSESKTASLTVIASPILNQPFVIFQDPTKGILQLNTENGEIHSITGPPANAIQLLENGAFLLSSDVPNSEQRGTWLGKFGDSNLMRIFAQPVIAQFERNREGRVLVHSVPNTTFVLLRAFDSWHQLNTDQGQISDLEGGFNQLRLISSPFRQKAPGPTIDP